MSCYGFNVGFNFNNFGFGMGFGQNCFNRCTPQPVAGFDYPLIMGAGVGGTDYFTHHNGAGYEGFHFNTFPCYNSGAAINYNPLSGNMYTNMNTTFGNPFGGLTYSDPRVDSLLSPFGTTCACWA